MLVLQQIPVDTHLEIGSRGLIVDFRDLIFTIGLTIAKFDDREPLVVEIHTKRPFILSTITEHRHTGTHQIERYGKTTKHRDGVFLHREELRLGGSRRSRQQQEQTNNARCPDRGRNESSYRHNPRLSI